MNIVRKIIKKTKEAEPSLNWVAFCLKGGGDTFSGFEAFEAEINNQRIKFNRDSSFNKNESTNEKYLNIFEKCNGILNKSEIQDSLLNTILPAGVYFKSVDQGACIGILLLKCESESISRSIEVKLDDYEYSYCFKTKTQFKGCLLNFENAEDNLGKDYQDNNLPIVFPGVYLKKIKEKLPYLNWAAVGIKVSEQGIENYKINPDSINNRAASQDTDQNEKEINDLFLNFKQEIVQDLFAEEKLHFPKNQAFKIHGVIYFIVNPIAGKQILRDVSDMVAGKSNKTTYESTCEFSFKICDEFSGIAFKYRLYESFVKEVFISELKIDEIATIKDKVAFIKTECELNEEAAKILSAFNGPLYFPINSQISDVFAENIIKHNGGGLFFDGEDSTSENSEGPILSNRAAEILSRYNGDLSFNYLPKLNYGDVGDEIFIAKVLGQHKGGNLSLLNLSEISEEAAINLFKHKNGVEIDSVSQERILKLYEMAEQRWSRMK